MRCKLASPLLQFTSCEMPAHPLGFHQTSHHSRIHSLSRVKSSMSSEENIVGASYHLPFSSFLPRICRARARKRKLVNDRQPSSESKDCSPLRHKVCFLPLAWWFNQFLRVSRPGGFLFSDTYLYTLMYWCVWCTGISRHLKMNMHRD